ncbi:hypothetical protein [Metabacillus halosaccharovorans]|uniref:hypothetical protein n=1 Tax=Metabacillus halosaccharovorans TaxID=930124 RepID=UPI00203A7391|nr:hypothetical protein [Metabacillus halosaccharovorans]MCM3443200.1 hypothetical protein [Metabacillus halosaccharovorans]
MFNEYEVYMLSKIKQNEMTEFSSFSIPITKEDKRTDETKSIEMICCQTVCC